MRGLGTHGCTDRVPSRNSSAGHRCRDTNAVVEASGDTRTRHSLSSERAARFVATPTRSDRDHRHPLRAGYRLAHRFGIEPQERPDAERNFFSVHAVHTTTANNHVDFFLAGLGLVMLAAWCPSWDFKPVDPESLRTEHAANKADCPARTRWLDVFDPRDREAHELEAIRTALRDVLPLSGQLAANVESAQQPGSGLR